MSCDGTGRSQGRSQDHFFERQVRSTFGCILVVWLCSSLKTRKNVPDTLQCGKILAVHPIFPNILTANFSCRVSFPESSLWIDFPVLRLLEFAKRIMGECHSKSVEDKLTERLEIPCNVTLVYNYPNSILLSLPKWSTSNFPCSFTRNHTSHSMNNLVRSSLREDSFNMTGKEVRGDWDIEGGLWKCLDTQLGGTLKKTFLGLEGGGGFSNNFVFFKTNPWHHTDQISTQKNLIMTCAKSAISCGLDNKM